MPVAVDLIVAILALWALYALLSTAFSLSFRVGGFFDLSVGASFLVGAYATWCCSRVAPVAVSTACGVVLAGVLAATLGRWLVAPLAVRVSPMALFVATLAILYIGQSVAALAFGTGALVLQSGPAATAEIWPVRVTYVQLLFGAVALAAVVALRVWLRSTPWGRFACAISDDRSLAGLFGVPVEKAIFRCYWVSGILAGLAGAYFVADRAVDPSQALTMLLSAMVAAIVGGEAILGAVLGALVLAVMEKTLGFWLQGNWQTTVTFAILLSVLIARGGALAQVARRRM